MISIWKFLRGIAELAESYAIPGRYQSEANQPEEERDEIAAEIDALSDEGSSATISSR
jgi:hypothetical protein